MSIALAFIVPIFYFYMSWFFPWDTFQVESSISITYVFDIIFGIVTLLIYKKKNLIGSIDKVLFLKHMGVVIGLGICLVGFSLLVKFNAPFKFIDHLFIQILVLAPIIEELVFRGAIFEVHANSKLKKMAIIGLSSVLFSISHTPALWHLPSEFHSFIIFQLFYTLILGWICAYSRALTGGIVAPISLHFGFNLVFYIAITQLNL